MQKQDAPLSRRGEGLADRKAGHSPVGERDAMNQQQQIEATKAEVACLGGAATEFKDLPPDVVREVLTRPDFREQLYGQEHGPAEPVINTALQQRIKEALDSTPPRSRARSRALAKVRWVLRDELGGYAARVGSIADGCVISAPDVKDAIVFDGRDNEEAKARYYEALTGLRYTVELL